MPFQFSSISFYVCAHVVFVLKCKKQLIPTMRWLEFQDNIQINMYHKFHGSTLIIRIDLLHRILKPIQLKYIHHLSKLVVKTP